MGPYFSQEYFLVCLRDIGIFVEDEARDNFASHLGIYSAKQASTYAACFKLPSFPLHSRRGNWPKVTDILNEWLPPSDSISSHVHTAWFGLLPIDVGNSHLPPRPLSGHSLFYTSSVIRDTSNSSLTKFLTLANFGRDFERENMGLKKKLIYVQLPVPKVTSSHLAGTKIPKSLSLAIWTTSRKTLHYRCSVPFRLNHL